MWRFLARRLLFSVALVVVVASCALLLTRLAPGDALSDQVATGVSGRTLAAERSRLGLDQPPGAQFAAWAARAVRLDFGTSLIYGRPVTALVAERVGNTALLATLALVLATAVGLPLGIVAGSRGGAVGRAIGFVSVVLLSMPSLVTSLLLVLVAARTGWFPTGGMTTPGAVADPSWWDTAADVAWHLAVPATALALPLAATLERLQARSLAETLREPFVTAALARGHSRRYLVWRFALKPSLRPVAALFGVVFGGLLSGSFVVELVTAWPGLGRLMFDALRARDLYLVAGCAAAGGTFLALGSVVSDLALAVVDPTLRANEDGRR